ncbi:DUF2442 domain-containing protein [Spirosoma sp. BT702]|uniref:DUF2442 domain-containing protein n=1 Tax=Spirosoma profusum TaxID=2771354 RepID=A0A927AR02_9BACT|nr:DUF2442 domain-containing protein [Spirosoma profusum]MBD2701501.1 DUF2442 domain-containing protein [Spirosoma profusum]
MNKRLNLSELPTFVDVQIDSDVIIFQLSDSRKVAVPLIWSKPLSAASVNQRNNFIISAYNVFWDGIDEIIGVENVLFGRELYL